MSTKNYLKSTEGGIFDLSLVDFVLEVDFLTLKVVLGLRESILSLPTPTFILCDSKVGLLGVDF